MADSDESEIDDDEFIKIFEDSDHIDLSVS
jgi:hypothetical protein